MENEEYETQRGENSQVNKKNGNLSSPNVTKDLNLFIKKPQQFTHNGAFDKFQ